MATEPQDNRPNLPKSQGVSYNAHAPRNVVQLLDLREIREMWGFGEDRIYRAVAHGRLRAYGRPGRQKYYSERELVAVFGAPPHSPNGPARREKSDRGGYQQRFELEETRAA